jgi:hypothetical protein
MAGIELGTGYVSIVAETDGFNRDVRRELERLEGVATRTGREMGDELGEGIVEGVRDARRDVERETDRMADSAGEAGGEAGDKFSSKFKGGLGGIVDGIKSLPIAGAFVAIGVGAAAAFVGAIKDGMGQEMARDLFQAQTGTTAAQAQTFARAAAESYVSVFGESVQANMDTLKTALYFDFIDADASAVEAQKVIEILQTVADAAGDTTDNVARGVGGLVSSGLVDDYAKAADLVIRSTQLGLNRQGDLIDSLSEYSAGWQQAGFSAEFTLGLIEQSMDKDFGGADNTDRASDAIREFGRRMGEEGPKIIEAIDGIGLSGADMFAALENGGPEAEAAFDQIFDAIRGLESPAQRTAAIVGILGDTAGDFTDVFEKWDPSVARSKFGDVAGAAADAASTIGGNSATSVEGALRSIGQASEDVKGALAQAFAPALQELAGWVSSNRETIVNFFFDLTAGVMKFGEIGLRIFAEITDVLGEVAEWATRAAAAFRFASGDFAGGMELWNKADGINEKFDGVADSARNMADNIRDELIPGINAYRETALEAARNSQAVADASKNVADAFKQVGGDANVTDAELRALQDALYEEEAAMLRSGIASSEASGHHAEQVEALRGVLREAGVAEDQIQTYIDKLNAIPPSVQTRLEIREQFLSQSAVDPLAGEPVAPPAPPPPPPGPAGSGIGRTGPPRTGAGLGDADTYGLTGTQRAFWERFSAQFPEAEITDAGIRTWDDGTGGRSYHYSGQALDIAGPNMGAYNAWIAANDPGAAELFYDPGTNIKDGAVTGAIGDHSDHVHYVPSGASSYDAAAMPADSSAADATSGGSSGSSGGSSGGGGGGGADWGGIVKDAAMAQVDDFFSVFGFSGSPWWLDTLLEGGGGGGGGGSSSGGSSAASGETAATSGTSSTATDATGTVASGDVRGEVQQVFADVGWTGSEWDAAQELINRESSWNPEAVNPSSGAYGLFQFIDGPNDPRLSGTSVRDQATSGARYIQDRYGSPSAALAFHDANNWYHDGGEVLGNRDVAMVGQVGEFMVKNGPSQEYREDLELINSGRPPRRGATQVNNFNVRGYEPHEVSRQIASQMGRARMRFGRQMVVA